MRHKSQVKVHDACHWGLRHFTVTTVCAICFSCSCSITTSIAIQNTKDHLSQDDMSTQTEHLQPSSAKPFGLFDSFLTVKCFCHHLILKLCSSHWQRINSLVPCILRLALFPPTISSNQTHLGQLLFHLDVMSALCVLDAITAFFDNWNEFGMSWKWVSLFVLSLSSSKSKCDEQEIKVFLNSLGVCKTGEEVG